jgi:hypothetical protein
VYYGLRAIIYNGNAHHKPRRREEPNVRHQDAPAPLRNSKIMAK